MTAFFGLISLNNRTPEDAELQRLSDALLPVGGHRTGIWKDQRASLGCHLVATTPEALQESLPFADPETGTAITGAIRLDNRAELLKAQDIGDKGMGDGQLVLAAYHTWGEDCCNHLLGDFAFALWDARRQKLFCVSDQIGACPLYYIATDAFFAFASTPEALACLEGVVPEPDDFWMMSFIAPGLGFAYGDRTNIKGVKRVPGGHLLTLAHDKSLRLQRYWRIENCPELSVHSDHDLIEAYREIFDRAVAARLRSVSPPAVLVSGGMDTAGIIGSLVRLAQSDPAATALPRDAYSVIADNPETCIESRCIQSLAACAGLTTHDLKVPSISGIGDLDQLLRSAWTHPHPADNSLLVIRLLADQARRDGHRVVLNGVNGDLTQMAPDAYIAPMLRAGQWLKAWRESQAAARHHTYLYGRSAHSILLQNTLRAFTPQALQRRHSAGAAYLHPFAHREFVERSQLRERLRDREVDEAEHLGPSDAWQFTRSLPMFATGLRGYQRIGALSGVEMRDPWSDKKLIEFYYRLPLEMKVRQGWTKYLARRANAERLPAEIIWRRSKEHLGFHIHSAAVIKGTHYTDAIVAEHLHHLEPYFDTDRLKLAYNQLKKGDTREYPDVYYPLTLAAWLAHLHQLKQPKHP